MGKRTDNIASFAGSVRTSLLCKNWVSCSTFHVCYWSKHLSTKNQVLDESWQEVSSFIRFFLGTAGLMKWRIPCFCSSNDACVLLPQWSMYQFMCLFAVDGWNGWVAEIKNSNYSRVVSFYLNYIKKHFVGKLVTCYVDKLFSSPGNWKYLFLVHSCQMEVIHA